MVKIYRPEPVDIEQRHGQGPPVALRAPHVELELGAERTQGEQVAGQRVSRLAMGKLRLELGDSPARFGELARIPSISDRAHWYLDYRLAEDVP
jgi:hypothetical protein